MCHDVLGSQPNNLQYQGQCSTGVTRPHTVATYSGHIQWPHTAHTVAPYVPNVHAATLNQPVSCIWTTFSTLDTWTPRRPCRDVDHQHHRSVVDGLWSRTGVEPHLSLTCPGPPPAVDSHQAWSLTCTHRSSSRNSPEGKEMHASTYTYTYTRMHQLVAQLAFSVEK